MENDVKLSKEGSCLCGSVTVKATELSSKVGVCHCGMCRRRGGGPLLAVDAGDKVTFKGEDKISVYNSSEWAERGFCRECGTNLFYRLKANQRHILPAGLFEGDFEMDHQIFIDEKPKYYDFANNTHNMTGAEVMAQFS